MNKMQRRKIKIKCNRIRVCSAFIRLTILPHCHVECDKWGFTRHFSAKRSPAKSLLVSFRLSALFSCLLSFRSLWIFLFFRHSATLLHSPLLHTRTLEQRTHFYSLVCRNWIYFIFMFFGAFVARTRHHHRRLLCCCESLSLRWFLKKEINHISIYLQWDFQKRGMAWQKHTHSTHTVAAHFRRHTNCVFLFKNHAAVDSSVWFGVTLVACRGFTAMPCQ